MVKLNNANNYEHLCNVVLDERRFPLAYAAKLNELMDNGQGEGMTEKEAREYLQREHFELELYYSPTYGMFAVETDAIDNGAVIYDPYTGRECEEADDLE